MKLLYVVPRLGGAGGVQRVLLLKAAYLARELHYDVSILVTNPDTGETLFDVAPGIKISYITHRKLNPLSYFLSYRNQLKKAVAAHKPDIILQCDNGLKSLLLPWLLPGYIPLVYEMHTSKFLIENAINRYNLLRLLPKAAALNFLLSKFTRVVALTPAGAAEWKLNNSTVIPNPLWLKSLGENPLTAKKIVVMGRHAPQKGYERMFSIWQKVAASNPDWSLEIYGAHNPEYDLKKMAANHKLERIVFLEPVRDIEHAYSQASVSIMTSVSEPFGMALLEAMECGVPCVAYNCPTGPATIIDNAVNGYLIKDNDEQAFIDALAQLMHSQELRQTLGKAAKKKAAVYNIDAIMQQWHRLFAALVPGA